MSGPRAFALVAHGRLGRGMAFNLAGLGPPIVFAVVALPLLSAQLGTARFGVLLIAWSVLLYLGLLNLGVGRALVHATARRDAADPALPGLVWTAVLLLLAVGAAGGAALFVAAPLLAGPVLGLDGARAAEATAAFRVLALAVPFTVSAAAVTAVLEARQRFGTLNAVAVPASALNYFGPLAALALVDSLVAVMAVLAAGRVAAWLLHLALAVRALPVLRRGVAFRRAELRPLLGFGGWVTVSHVVSPLMVYTDRFVIGALISASAVAYYATPQEVVVRLGAVATAVTVVLYPAFAGGRGPAQLRALLDRGTLAVWALVLPLAVLLSAFGGEILGVWMGEDYAREGALVLRWLALGLLAVSLARVAATFLTGVGRPDLTGRLHLAELPVYAAALWALTAAFGVRGAAAAWCLRAAVDALALLWLVARQHAEYAGYARRAAWLAALGASAVALPAVLPAFGARVVWLAVVIAGVGVLGWRGAARGRVAGSGDDGAHGGGGGHGGSLLVTSHVKPRPGAPPSR